MKEITVSRIADIICNQFPTLLSEGKAAIWILEEYQIKHTNDIIAPGDRVIVSKDTVRVDHSFAVNLPEETTKSIYEVHTGTSKTYII